MALTKLSGIHCLTSGFLASSDIFPSCLERPDAQEFCGLATNLVFR